VSYIVPTQRPLHVKQRGSSRQNLEGAQTLFRIFHRFPAPVVIRLPCRRIIPKVLVQLGSLRGLIYSSDKGSRGCPKTYIHFMERPPKLACNPNGTQLYILGGRYRVTPRGIEG
jgi:hypothetical protein